MRRRSSGCSCIHRTAALSLSGLPTGNSRPVMRSWGMPGSVNGSRQTSGVPSQSLATTGTAHSSACGTVRGRPSRSDGWQSRSMARIIAGMRSWATRPVRMTCFSRPISRTRAARRSDHQPSPTQSRRQRGSVRTSLPRASSRVSWPLCSARRATVPMTNASFGMPSAARTSSRVSPGAACRKRSVSMPERTVTNWSGRPMPRARNWRVMASATETIAWHRRAARRSARV